ncbi:MAG: methyltransferase [Mycobacteriales bacterium]
MPLPVPPAVESGVLRTLAGVLRRDGLTEQTYRTGFETLPGGPDRARLPLIGARLAALGPAGCLTALLAFGIEQDAAALPDGARDALLAAGFAVVTHARVRAPWRLTPLAGLLVLSDHASDDQDRVMTPGVTTTDLAWALPRPPGRRVLDVGTGSGVLALLAAAQGASSVATDVSSRACTFAGLSADFNDLSLDVRTGSLLEPVAGERFDLVVSQPPFIPRPDDVPMATWLHAGSAGDELALALLRGLPDVLAPGGRAVLRVDLLPERATALAVQERAGLQGLDVVVVSWPGATGQQLAYAYAGVEDPRFGERYEAAAAAYLRHLERTGVERVRSTLLLVRRRAGGKPAVGDLETNAALQWEQIMERTASLVLAEEGDAVLLRARVGAPGGARVSFEQDLTGELEVAHVLRYPAGSALADAVLDEETALLLQLAAGGRPVAALVAGFAEQLGRPIEEVAAPALTRLRAALRRGHLLPRD